MHVHPDGLVTVDMGPAVFRGPADVEVLVPGTPAVWLPAVAVDVGNPHAVVFVDDLSAPGPLRTAPEVRPRQAFPSGVNVEFARIREVGHVSMRVHERGVGETQSCGTGACAVFAEARARTRSTSRVGDCSWVTVPTARWS